MTLEWYQIALAILGGMLAGIINTLAGSGSVVTLPILVFLLGEDQVSVANGTNRVGVIVQNIVGIVTFQRHGQLNTQGSLWVTAPAFVGAFVGAGIAVDLDEQMMNLAIGIVMVIMLFVVLLNPKQWLREQSEVAAGRPRWWVLVLFFFIGMYGGFIQAGVGVFILIALVMGVGYTMAHANAIKLVIVLALSFAAIAVFIANDQVNWWFGALMAVGQSLGAWLAARYASNNPRANVWVRRLLIAVIIISIAKFFGLLDLIA